MPAVRPSGYPPKGSMGRADQQLFISAEQGRNLNRAISSAAMPEVTPTDARPLIDGGAQLVDVRTPGEYAAGHIPGSRHVPLPEVQTEAAGLDRDRPVVIYCRSGDRSGMAADAFAAS